MGYPKSKKVIKDHMQSLLLVTDANRRHCIVLGRKMYVYQKNGSQFDNIGEFVIRPRLKKGNYTCDGISTYIHNEEGREEYQQSFDQVISHLIKIKKLYINIQEPLSKFE